MESQITPSLKLMAPSSLALSLSDTGEASAWTAGDGEGAAAVIGLEEALA